MTRKKKMVRTDMQTYLDIFRLKFEAKLSDRQISQGYCAQFTDKFHENYFSYIIHIDSGLESNVSAYHRRSVPSSHAFASTLQLHKSASRCISDSS